MGASRILDEAGFCVARSFEDPPAVSHAYLCAVTDLLGVSVRPRSVRSLLLLPPAFALPPLTAEEWSDAYGGREMGLHGCRVGFYSR